MTAVNELNASDLAVAMIHLRHLYPLPSNLKTLLEQFDTILVPELNCGQLSKIIREQFLLDVVSFNKVTGKLFLVREIKERILQLLR